MTNITDRARAVRTVMMNENTNLTASVTDTRTDLMRETIEALRVDAARKMGTDPLLTRAKST